MRRTLLALSVLIASGAWAQQSMSPALKSRVHEPVPYTKEVLTGKETIQRSQLRGSGNPGQTASQNGSVIGTTSYDLQTNASVQRRLWRHTDGTMSSVFTYSSSLDLASGDRGTGHVYYDGSSWSAAPTVRLEPQRCGWPNILSIGGNEVNFAHNNAASTIMMTRRPVKGVGTWNSSNVTAAFVDLLWNRTAVGGANGQTIHMIGVTAPTGGTAGGQLYQGLDGALLYYRSQDGGVSWDRQDILLPQLTSQDWVGFDGDSYAIAAQGNTVAFAIFNDWADVVLMKSTDNGNTWTKTIINDFPFTKYVPDQMGGSDVNQDGIADTLITSDGAGSIIMDANGMAHVFFGKFVVLDDDLSDGNTSYFPFLSDSLYYWNEDMGENNYRAIAGAEDRDGNGAVINPNETAATTALYFTSLAGIPSAVYDDATGNIYLTLQMYLEDISNGAQSYRHIFITSSTDGGCTWTVPEDVTDSGSGFEECVFASIANDVSDSIRFVYQEDFEPGLAVRGDEDGFVTNEIVYVALDKNSLSTTPGVCASYIKADGVDFCAGDSVMLEASCGTSYTWSTGATTQMISATTYGTYTVTITTACGAQEESITLSAPSTGPQVTISTSSLEICPGDNATLTASQASQASYLWSNGATTISTTINNPGTYTVTVTNCGGTTVENITLIQPTTNPSPIIIGDQTICAGQSGTLEVTNVVSGSYLWSTGSTSNTTTVTTTGTYTVTATNCAGTGVASINVINDPLPMGTTSIAGPNSFCEGDASAMITADDGASWLWSDGSTGQSISLSSVSQSGTYTVTSYNTCGDSAVSSGVTVTIFPPATAPTITYSGNGSYTANATGAVSYQWFLNGNSIDGATEQSYEATQQEINSNITVRITDGNGCTATSTDYTVGIRDLSRLAGDISIFPNPSEGEFFVRFDNVETGAYEITLTNTLGQTLITQTTQVGGQQIERIPTESLASGMYFLTVSNGEAAQVHTVSIR